MTASSPVCHHRHSHVCCVSFAAGNSFNDEERIVACGYDNGDVKLFDLRTNSIRWETNVGNGVVSVEFDRKDIEMNKMVVTTLESKFRVYDMRTQHPKDGFAYSSIKVSWCWLHSLAVAMTQPPSLRPLAFCRHTNPPFGMGNTCLKTAMCL